VRNLETALERIGLASAFFYTVPGPKMLWQFGELGYDFSINRCPNGNIDNGCRTDPKPIRWNYLEVPGRKKLFNLTSDLIYLKTNYEVFNTEVFDYQLEAPLKRVRLYSDELDVIVVGNFRVVPGNIRPIFNKRGMWYDYISGDSLMVTDTFMIMNLAPGEFRLYTDQRIERPSGDFTTSTIEPFFSDPDISLYPNPSYEKSFFLSGSIEGVGTIIVSDINGRQIAIREGIDLSESAAILLPPDLSSGVYIINVRHKQGSKTFKWILQ